MRPPKIDLAPPADVHACAFDHQGAEYVVLSYPIEATYPLPPALTSAERGIATALLCGDALKDIAAARGTSPRTVANQTRAIYRKLGVGSRLELGVLLRNHAREVG